MSYEYIVLMRSTAHDPLRHSMNRAAYALQAPVRIDDNGIRTVLANRVIVTGQATDDEDLEMSRRTFGIPCNVYLSLEELGRPGPTEPDHLTMLTMLRVVMALVDGATDGVFLGNDLSPAAVILAFAGGRVFLNPERDIWTLWPEVLAAIPESRRLSTPPDRR